MCSVFGGTESGDGAVVLGIDVGDLLNLVKKASISDFVGMMRQAGSQGTLDGYACND
jgi:hypothetical protein